MRSILFAIILLAGLNATAQSFVLNLPRVSQGASVQQTIGITSLSVDYHSPQLKDRVLLGNLIPYNEEGTIPWRGGADENTVFSTSTNIKVGGQNLPKGQYGLHFWVTEQSIEAIFSSNYDSWGSFSYKQELDVIRMTLNRSTAPWKSDRLRYGFEQIEGSSANLIMHWGEEYWSIPIEVDVNTTVLAQINQDLQNQPGWMWIGYYEAAKYCMQNEVNLEQASKWINRSMFINPNPTNFVGHGKLLLAQEQSNSDIISALENSLESFPVTWKEYNALSNFALSELKDDKNALSWVETSMQMDENFTNSSTKATILRSQGKNDAAEKIENKALEKSSNAEANTYGYKLLFAGDVDRAVEILEYNATRFPDDPNVHDSLGEAYLTSGQNQKAEESLRKSLSLNPPANVRQNSLRLLAKMGVNTSSL